MWDGFHSFRFLKAGGISHDTHANILGKIFLLLQILSEDNYLIGNNYDNRGSVYGVIWKKLLLFRF